METMERSIHIPAADLQCPRDARNGISGSYAANSVTDACLRISSIVKFRIPEFAGYPGDLAHLPAGGQICVEDLSPLSTFRPTPLGGSFALNAFAP
jgi:hypothetical protein